MNPADSRRAFLKNAGLSAGALWLAPERTLLRAALAEQTETLAPEYKIHIRDSVIEIGPKRFISTVTYNGQFPGPLLRFKEGQPVTVGIFNDTDTPEQLHWHGQKVPVDVDGAAEEGTPFIPAHGQRIVTFTPGPSGLRFYHTHNRAGANVAAGQYGGQVGPAYVEPKENPGRYDREIFLTLKEFEPTLSKAETCRRTFFRLPAK